MSARDKLHARLFKGPNENRDDLLDDYRAEILREAADKLALEMVPETAGAGPGFLLAIRLCVRSLRRMSDKAVTS